MDEGNLKYLKKDNSNIYQYSRSLSSELKKDRYKKIDLLEYSNFLQALDGVYVDPSDHANFTIDLERFTDSLNKQDLDLFKLYFVEEYTQTEIADILGRTQGYVSYKLDDIESAFETYYFGDDNE